MRSDEMSLYPGIALALVYVISGVRSQAYVFPSALTTLVYALVVNKNYFSLYTSH